MTPTVTVMYNLSAAGQKAALVAGKSAAKAVSEVMPFDASLIDALTIRPDGSLVLDATAYAPAYGIARESLYLDAPPETLADLVAAWTAHRARIDAKIADEKAKRAADEAEAARKRQAKAEHDKPIVDALLDRAEAADLLEKVEGLTDGLWYGFSDSDGRLAETPEQTARRKAIYEKREAARIAAAAAKKQAEADALNATIAKHGGLYWQTPGRMCDFSGYDLWSAGQTKRWVGTFSRPKGIDAFCSSPRDEFIFDVSGLVAGDCIQGGGYDTNSRGKRRHESEFFGIVVRNDNDELVVKIVGSRADALKERK